MFGPQPVHRRLPTPPAPTTLPAETPHRAVDQKDGDATDGGAKSKKLVGVARAEPSVAC